MAQKTKNNLPSPDASTEVVAHIGPGTRVTGRLSGQEDLRVHGTVEGSVRLASTLFVEPEGVILAEVHARDVLVSGTVVGNIHADNAIVLTASARVVGDLRSPRVSLEPGAALRGAISMDPPDVEALEAEAQAARGYGATRTAAPTVRGAISERPANGENRRAAAPARQQQQQQQGVRLPPRRAQAFTAARPEPHAWAPREPVRPALRPAFERPAFERPAYEDETIIVQHPAIRSDDRRKKVARPKPLARGKHKVERVD